MVGSGVTDGGQGGEPHSPWQAKCKNWAPLVDIFEGVFDLLSTMDTDDIQRFTIIS